MKRSCETCKIINICVCDEESIKLYAETNRVIDDMDDTGRLLSKFRDMIGEKCTMYQENN